ncbi:MAG: hypothetical protein V1702_01805 [Candidatus Woesearchaeota archaeon]
METEEDIDAWYEEKNQHLMANLVKAMENKEKIDEAEALYTKEFNKLFEAYRKKKANFDDSLLKQKAKAPAKGFPAFIKKILRI